MIEIGLVRTDDTGFIESQLNLIINPEEPLPEKITEITGLTDDDVKAHKPFRKQFDTIDKFLTEAGSDGELVAHNMPFDDTILTNELKRMGLTWPARWPQTKRCSVQEFRHVFGYNVKLTKLYEHATGEEPEQTHRALDDVMLMHKALLNLGWWDKG